MIRFLVQYIYIPLYIPELSREFDLSILRKSLFRWYIVGAKSIIVYYCIRTGQHLGKQRAVYTMQDAYVDDSFAVNYFERSVKQRTLFLLV